ncbi:hypothetical protein [Aminobacter sp. MDW-2]|uniref:hypothetical protein n=1 Tax=Aminobacter sp. MDW-2 TaxID=2666139 RepID=UPI0012B03A74|nr:hypothetical protein [Aminobacter sp. MDW-2]MRX32832.1 hypothetical protein [Aminobacter sp. MDW-2]QNH34511.1 hypothetical protein H5P29_00715 [Aminobacter sp. MDW-2]
MNDHADAPAGAADDIELDPAEFAEPDVVLQELEYLRKDVQRLGDYHKSTVIELGEAETSRAQLRAAMDRAFAAFKKQDAELATDIGRLRSKSATAKAVLASRQRAVLELEQVLA